MNRMTVSICLMAALAGGVQPLAGTPLGTGFTYQGLLSDGGVPAEGTYEFQFHLYDAAAGGNQVGPTISKSVCWKVRLGPWAASVFAAVTARGNSGPVNGVNSTSPWANFAY